MAVLVVDFFEVIEVNPMQGEAQSRAVALELAFKSLAEVKAVRDLRQRVVARKPFDLLAGPADGGDIFLNIHPSTSGDRSHSFVYAATIIQMDRLREHAAKLKLREVFSDPIAGCIEAVPLVVSTLAFNVVENDVRSSERSQSLLYARLHIIKRCLPSNIDRPTGR